MGVGDRFSFVGSKKEWALASPGSQNAGALGVKVADLCSCIRRQGSGRSRDSSIMYMLWLNHQNHKSLLR